MSEEQTQRLIANLADDLAPVRLVPRLRSLVLAVLVVFALIVAYSISQDGIRSGWWELVTSDASYLAVLLGLAACGFGATLAGVAGAMPGREVVVRRGSVVAGLGLVAAAGVSLLAAAVEGSFAGTLSADWMCLAAALQFSPLPVAAVLLAISRGWVGSPGVTAVAGLAGAACAGALSIHLACALLGARHFLLGHASAPVVLALVVSLPAAWWLRRVAR